MTLSDRARGRENLFDFLRFVAASLVILSHSFPLVGASFEPFAWATGSGTFGRLAVCTFFAMSGFLITKSWSDDPRLFAYLGKRILRIAPGLIASVLFAVVIVGPLTTQLSLADYLVHPQTRQHLKTTLLFPVYYDLPGVFAHNPFPGAVNGSLWSLTAEVLMYALVGVLGLSRLLRCRQAVAALFAGLVVFEWHVLPRAKPSSWLSHYLFLPSFLLCYKYYLAGMLCYLYRERIPLSGSWLTGCLLLQILACRTPYFGLIMQFSLPYAIFYIAYANVPALPRFAKYGDFSYGMYIYAFPIQQLIVHWAGGRIDWLPLFGLSLPATLGVSYLSWRFLEAPALRLRRWFARSADGPARQVAAPAIMQYWRLEGEGPAEADRDVRVGSGGAA